MTRESTQIPLFDVLRQRKRIEASLTEAIQRVLAHGDFIQGPEVDHFERSLADFTGAKQVVTCANGTDALVLVLMAEGVGPGDAVIVPSFSFVATAEAVALRGATPVFADIDPSSFTIDPSSVERCLEVTQHFGLRPRMVIAVDLYGQPADYDALLELTRDAGITLVADAAQSLGSSIGARKTGTLADYTATSFFPTKPLGCYGDGGAVFTDDPVRSHIIRSLASHGRGSDKGENIRIGMNSRLDSIQAAILLQKMNVFPQELAIRNEIADRYRRDLADLGIIPHVRGGVSSAWALYTLTIPQSLDREAVKLVLSEAGISTGIYYQTPLHLQGVYRAFPRDPLPLKSSENAARSVLSIPMFPELCVHDQQRICLAVRDAMTGRSDDTRSRQI